MSCGGMSCGEFRALTMAIPDNEQVSLTLEVPRKFQFQKIDGPNGGPCLSCMSTGQLFAVKDDGSSTFLEDAKTGFKARVVDIDNYHSLLNAPYTALGMHALFGANTTDEEHKKGTGFLQSLSDVAGKAIHNIATDPRVKALGNRAIGTAVKAAETAVFLAREDAMNPINKGVIEGLL